MNDIIYMSNSVKFTSTLLIPRFILPFFNEKVKKLGGVEPLFRYVVNKKYRIYDFFPSTLTGRTIYAPKGTGLKKINFRPRNEDWEKFRILAHSRRISMTYLFVLLLYFLDWIKEDHAVGVPTKNQNIQLKTTLFVSPTFTIIELRRWRV